MPIHDWTRVRADRFHDFQQSWTIALRNELNARRLPKRLFCHVGDVLPEMPIFLPADRYVPCPLETTYPTA